MMSLEPAIDAAIAKALAAGSGSFSSFSTGPIEFSGSNGNTNFEGSYESSSFSSSFEGSSGNAAGNAAGQLLGNEDMTNNGWAAAGIAQQKPSGATAFHAGAMNQVQHSSSGTAAHQSVTSQSSKGGSSKFTSAGVMGVVHHDNSQSSEAAQQTGSAGFTSQQGT